MKASQDCGKAADVIRVCVGECQYIKLSYATRPEHWRYDLFAYIDGLRSMRHACAKCSAKTTTVLQKRFSIRRDEQKRIALTDIDGFHQQRVVRVLDSIRGNSYEGGGDHHNADLCRPGFAPRKAIPRCEHKRQCKKCAKHCDLPR